MPYLPGPAISRKNRFGACNWPVRPAIAWRVLFRPAAAAQQASPAELRLQLRGLLAMPLRESSALEVRVLKRRGGWSSSPFVVEFHDRLNQVTPDFADMPARNPARPLPELAFVEPHRYSPAHDHQQQ